MSSESEKNGEVGGRFAVEGRFETLSTYGADIGSTLPLRLHRLSVLP